MQSRWALNLMKTLNQPTPRGFILRFLFQQTIKPLYLSHFLCPAAKCALTNTPRMPLSQRHQGCLQGRAAPL